MFEFDGWNQKNELKIKFIHGKKVINTRKDTGVVGEAGPTLDSCTTLERSNNKRTIK